MVCFARILRELKENACTITCIKTLKGGEDGGVCWDKASSDDKKLYIDNLESKYLYLWDDVLACNDPNCSNADHIMSLNSLYQNIINACHKTVIGVPPCLLMR